MSDAKHPSLAAKALNVDVLGEVLSFLDGTEVARVASVSKSFAQAARNASLWGRQCRDELAKFPPALRSTVARELGLKLLGKEEEEQLKEESLMRLPLGEKEMVAVSCQYEVVRGVAERMALLERSNKELGAKLVAAFAAKQMSLGDVKGLILGIVGALLKQIWPVMREGGVKKVLELDQEPVHGVVFAVKGVEEEKILWDVVTSVALPELRFLLYLDPNLGTSQDFVRSHYKYARSWQTFQNGSSARISRRKATFPTFAPTVTLCNYPQAYSTTPWLASKGTFPIFVVANPAHKLDHSLLAIPHVPVVQI